MSEIPGTALTPVQNGHLGWLEAESIYIIREVVAEYYNPALLFSGGKDSIAILHLALKTSRLGERKVELPFPLVRVDTGHNYPEVIILRDEQVAKLGACLMVGHVEDSIERSTMHLCKGTDSYNVVQVVTLLETIESHGLDALMGGARRDEEKARAKKHTFSFRDELDQWNPRAQRPELRSLYNAHMTQDEQMRVFPISNQTELDAWQYIARENLVLPLIYYVHEREVVCKSGLLVLVMSIMPKADDDVSEALSVRFRTVGDISCTCPAVNTAATSVEIITETAVTEITERGAACMDDQMSEASVEKHKEEGYF